MEIPKSLQDEIQSVQNKLKNAIQNHQVYVGKLNDDPNNEELLGQIRDIQEHIISLSKCQKQVVQRLRKEVKLYEAANSNGTKVSIATLLGLNNNNNITNNNETRNNDSKQTVNGKNLNGLRRRSSKDDYEDGIQNSEPPSPNDNCQNNCAKGRESEETDSNDEDIIEIAIDNNSIAKRRNSDQISKIELFDQLDFLGCLGLITSDKYTELQNKRAERKRRSTANPQFVYSNWEIPTKRKRHSYLQSNGSAPQTRQTTARLNGPSPPPSKVSGGRPSRSSPPLPKASIKSLIPTQKSSTRPNILRNNPESKLFSGRIKSENGLVQGQAGINVKAVQSVGSKAVHIPGLPSSLTIERIENDSAAVCIHCRNPGSLNVCEICAAYFHVSCHLVSSAPLRTCPKCVWKITDPDDSDDALSIDLKEENEIATTSKPSGNVGETGKDSEVNKTACGFHKVDATEERSGQPAGSVNQLPTSTFLIPVAPKPIPSSSSGVVFTQSETVESTASTVGGESNCSNSYSSILLNQLSQPPNNKSDSKVPYAYQMPVASVKPEKPQSYLILRKIPESGGTAGRSRSSSFEDQRGPSSIFEYQQSSSTGYNDHDQSEIKSIPTAEYSQSSGRQFSGKYKFNGQGFNGAEDATEKAASFNGDKPAGKLHSKLSINQLRPSRQSDAFIPLHSIINDVETIGEPEEPANAHGAGEITAGKSSPSVVDPDGKGQPQSNLLNSLFPSNNQPHSFPGGSSTAENSGPEQGAELERDVGELKNRQSKYDPHNRSRPRLQSSSFSNVGEYVKLEEAHLPAPLRPNVVRKSVDAIDAILKKNREKSGGFTGSGNRNDAQSRRDHLPAPLRPNLVRKSVDAIDALLKKNREKSVKFIGSDNQSRMEVRRSSSEANSDYTSFENYHNENLRATLDFIAVERKHSSNHVREEHAKKVYRREKKVLVAGPCVSKTELLHRSLTAALRSKQHLLPHEIKPEIERQDLPINECEISDNREETTLKDRINDVITLSQESKTKLGINAVSTENMQVLEQFESAMLEVDEDETANC